MKKKLKLEALDVASFPTTEAKVEKRGTVRAHGWTDYDCSMTSCTTTDTRWDCSIDFCSEGGGCGPTIVYTQ